jgi:hypothetical protein
MAEGTHRWVGNHAQEVSVGEARVMLAPGDIVTLSSEDEETNAALIEGGGLISTTEAPQAEPQPQEAE